MTYAHDAHCNTIHVAGPQECPPAREDTSLDFLAGVTESAVLRPGDKLVLRLAAQVTPEIMARLREEINAYLPDIDVVYIGGPVEQLLVVKS